MSISNNRFRIYELLFSKPLYLYAQNNNGKLTNNVLILGSGEVGTEAFKAVYWCGQYSLDTFNREAPKEEKINFVVSKKFLKKCPELLNDGKKLQTLFIEFLKDYIERQVS